MASGVIRTTWSWPSSTASRVCSMNADTSLARKFSPSARPDHERRVAPRAHDHVRGVRVDREQREGALQPPADPPHCLGQTSAVTASLPTLARVREASPLRSPGAALAVTTPLEQRQLVLEQVGRALGVGVAGELDPARLELGPQPGEVLDDAVVDHGEAAGRGAVRVGVAVGRAAVGGPAGVPDAGRARC